jgi:hypothetical protein
MPLASTDPGLRVNEVPSLRIFYSLFMRVLSSATAWNNLRCPPIYQAEQPKAHTG